MVIVSCCELEAASTAFLKLPYFNPVDVTSATSSNPKTLICLLFATVPPLNVSPALYVNIWNPSSIFVTVPYIALFVEPSILPS